MRVWIRSTHLRLHSGHRRLLHGGVCRERVWTAPNILPLRFVVGAVELGHGVLHFYCTRLLMQLIKAPVFRSAYQANEVNIIDVTSGFLELGEVLHPLACQSGAVDPAHYAWLDLVHQFAKNRSIVKPLCVLLVALGASSALLNFSSMPLGQLSHARMKPSAGRTCHDTLRASASTLQRCRNSGRTRRAGGRPLVDPVIRSLQSMTLLFEEPVVTSFMLLLELYIDAAIQIGPVVMGSGPLSRTRVKRPPARGTCRATLRASASTLHRCRFRSDVTCGHWSRVAREDETSPGARNTAYPPLVPVVLRRTSPESARTAMSTACFGTK